MKRILLLMSFCFFLNTSAQMYVSNNSYVFVNNQYLYVKQNVELNGANANMYLRNQSQLLQGTAIAGANKGLGKLSVFQEGTVNNYQYNLWCSPIGLPGTLAGNKDFGISLLNRPSAITTSSPVTITTSYDGVSTNTSLSVSSRWIYTFITSTTYPQWIYNGNTTTIGAGLGFTMKGVSGTDTTVADAVETRQNNTGSAQRYDFRGLPNDGLIENTVSLNNFTLVGNPYPSAIDLNMFLAGDNPGPDLIWGTLDDPIKNNPSIDGTAYFWEQVVVGNHTVASYQGGYGKYTPGGGYLRADIWSYNSDGSQNVDLDPDLDTTSEDGTAFARRFSPIGQGFMVMGNGVAPNTVNFQNKYRVFVKEGVTSEFARASSSSRAESVENYPEIANVAGIDYTQQRNGYAPQLRIHAIINNNQGIVRTALGFADGYTNGYDSSADATSDSETSPFSFYHILENSNNEYSMSFSPFNIDKRLPIGFRNNIQATFKVKIVETKYGFDSNQKVYIHDKVSDIYHDIKDGFFELTLPPGDNKTQFEITFKNTNIVLDNPTFDENAFQVFQNNTSELLTVVNSLQKDIKKVEMYDVTGKAVVKKTNLGSSERIEISTSGLSEGVYIVKIKTTDNLSIDKKVAISRK